MLCFCYLSSGQGIVDRMPPAPASACQQGPCHASPASCRPAWTNPPRHDLYCCQCPLLALAAYRHLKLLERPWKNIQICFYSWKYVFNLWCALQLPWVAQAGTKALVDLWHGRSGWRPFCVDFLNSRTRKVSKDTLDLVCSNAVIKSD